MLCYRCGSHVQDGAEKCWNCDTRLASTSKSGVSLEELRERQRTKSRISGVVYKIGDVIANRYKVRDIAGSGGAGVVYRAHDQEIDVDVALKVINAKLLQTAEEKKLFTREIKQARKLNHQNIVRIYDEAKDADRVFYTMQFLEGLSLRKIIDLRKEKKQHFALAEIEPIYNQLCQALDYAHKTTFHGNLKPDNIIVLPDLLKVTDFGLIKGLPRKPFLAIQKSRTPNFQYLAPEVRLEVEDLSNATDIFSLGIILAEMLTGQVVDESKPEQLSVAKTGLDSGVLRVIRRALLRAPKERYPTAGELYEDLRTILARGEVRTVPTEASNVQVEPALAGVIEAATAAEDARVAAADAPPAPAAQDPGELATEAPTQRLDISKHGARPVEEEDAGAVRRVAPPPAPAPKDEVEGGTGTFAAIDDDMIEESSGSPSQILHVDGALEVPPLAEEEERSFEEGDEPTEALDSMIELSASEIVLVADPRATNVIEVDGESAKIKVPGQVAKAPVIIHEPEGPTKEIHSQPAQPVQPAKAESKPEKRAEKVIVDLPAAVVEVAVPLPGAVAGATVPDAAFVRANEPTTAGRLDVVPAKTPVVGKKEDRRHQATAPVIRGMAAGEEVARIAAKPAEDPIVPSRAAEVTVSPAASLAEPKVIPRSPTVALPSNGSTPPALNGSSNGRSPMARPMTRPRMAAIRPNAPLATSALFEPADGPRDPTGARPLVVDKDGVHSKPKTVTGVEPVVMDSERQARRKMLYVFGGGGALAFIALLVVASVVVMRFLDQQQKQIELLQQQLTAQVSVAKTAAANEEEAARDKEEAGRKAKEAEDAERQAQAAALEAKNKAQAELRAAEEAEKQKKAAEAAEKRKAAEEAGKLEKQQLAIADVERKKREREEAAQKQAETREAREREARIKAEEKAERLRAEQAALADKRADAKAEAEAKRQAAAEAKAEAKAKAEQAKAEEAARKKAEEQAKKDEAAATAAAVAAVAPAGKSCPKGMVLIETGAFMMGAPRNDPERNFGDLQYASVDVGGFCIDYYEAPNGRGRAPTAKVSFAAAERACKAKGKRLCSEPEWEKACKGPSGLRYPYGNQWDPAACATEDDEGNDREVSKSGTFERCRSGFNVLDMSGNLAEWTSTPWPGGGGYVVKGGSSDRPGYDGRCAARKKKPGNATAEVLGFRCCADPK